MNVLPKPTSHAHRTMIDPSAVVDPGASIGAGTKIWHFTHVIAGAEIGERCVLGQNVMVGGGAKLGNGVKVQNNVSIYDGVTLEDEVFCGPSVVFTNVINPRAAIERKSEFRPTLVRRGATLGANSTIVCGVEIGEYAFVGAGSVVTRDVAPFALVTGAPARRIRWMCVCGGKLKFEGAAAACPACGECYEKQHEESIRRC